MQPPNTRQIVSNMLRIILTLADIFQVVILREDYREADEFIYWIVLSSKYSREKFIY